MNKKMEFPRGAVLSVTLFAIHQNQNLCTWYIPSPYFLLKGVSLPVMPSVKFPGFIFDSQLSWEPHIWQLQHSEKPRSILRVLTRSSWGLCCSSCSVTYSIWKLTVAVSSTVMLQSQNYPFYAPSTLLESGFWMGLHLCSCVPWFILYPHYLFYSAVFSPNLHYMYEMNLTASWPVGLYIQKLLESHCVNVPQVVSYQHLFSTMASSQPTSVVCLVQHGKSRISALLNRQYFTEMASTYTNCTAIYSDGSLVNRVTYCLCLQWACV
jgi:hypothetical protein